MGIRLACVGGSGIIPITAVDIRINITLNMSVTVLAQLLIRQEQYKIKI